MNQKKSKKIIIILIVILLILILVAGLAFAYLETDIFKSNKTTFFKYLTQISDNEKGFVESNLKQYHEKKSNSQYSDEGSFSVNAESSSQDLSNVNKFTVSYNGQVDGQNKKNEQDIDINYSASVKFPLKFKKIDNKLAVQSDYIGGKYIAVETDKLSNLSSTAQTSGGDDTTSTAQTSEDADISKEIKESGDIVTEVQNLKKNPFSADDLKQIKNTYLPILNHIGDDKFSSVNDSNGKGYKLKLSGSDAKNVLVELLETLSKDQNTIDKINEYLKAQKNSAKITATQIGELTTNLKNNSNIDSENIEITLYKKSGKTSKIVIALNEGKLEIGKEFSKNKVNYDILLSSNNNVQLSYKMAYEGLKQMQAVKENYEIGIQDSSNNYKYMLENNVTFTNTNIEELNSDNSLVLTDYDEQTVSNFLEQVVQRVSEVNDDQMKQLGIEAGDNPILHLLPTFSENYLSDLESIKTSNINEQDVNIFNQKFEVYQSTNLQGVTVKGLLTTIGLNNEQQDEDRQIKEINFNGEEYEASSQNIAFIKEDIKTDSYYRVEFEKDQETGIIYRAVINPK